ncbi:Hypothetical predicted protein [Podarcis lilfordi]|uniref:Uncharacterized protein n=1 Tax=Podarcis lilfordi TaxID=74358 RepID=A0AA35KGD9_9SAUR|nr:Hypothetical predicted protein [Podarcis lilfordi]
MSLLASAPGSKYKYFACIVFTAAFAVNQCKTIKQIFETEKCFKFWLGFHSYIEILLMATNSRRASMLFCCNTNGQQSPSVFHT